MNIEEIISSMTLKDKIAFCIGADFWNTKAYEKYGIFRTASRMHEIRKAGIGIHTTLKTGKNRFGVDCRYAEYSLE